MGILNDLGIDPEDFHAEDLAACSGMDTHWFFDKEEEYGDDILTYSDPVIASIVDSTCITCPISQECLIMGRRDKRWGVWGGVYLRDGEVDNKMNKHKSEEDWEQWEKVINSGI